MSDGRSRLCRLDHIRLGQATGGLFGRLVAFAFALLIAVIASGTANAQALFQMTVEPTFGSVYPAGRWVPIRVELRNDSASVIDGTVRMPISLPGSTTEFRFPVSVPPQSRVAASMFVYLPEAPISQPGAPRKTGTNAVAIADWLGADGARIARTEVLGRPDSIGTDGTTEAAAPPGFLLLSVYGDKAIDSRDVFQVSQISELMSQESEILLTTGRVHISALPRHVAGYGAVKAVILGDVSPDVMDEGQRQALKAYLLAGGILILPAPLGASDPTGTWITELLPMAIIGSRESSGIVPGNSSIAQSVGNGLPASMIAFRGTVEIAEAVNRGGEALLSDADYVHVSQRRVGLGRVVFTSFPINALDPADPRTRELLRDILELGRPFQERSGSALVGGSDQILESMIGAPAAPWSHAAIIAGGYLALMVLIQFLFPRAKQPTAFALGAVVAIACCAALLTFASLRHGDDGTFSAARLATLDLGEEGGGMRREMVALFGRDDPELSLSVPDAVTLRPLAASADAPAVLAQLPFAAPRAGVRSGRVDRIWEASQPIDQAVSLQASLRFEADGVKISFDNHLGMSVSGPLVVWNRGCYRLQDLPEEQSSATLGEKNPSGDFTNVSVIASEEATLRGRILRSAAVPATGDSVASIDEMQPTLVGWLDPVASELARPMTMFSQAPDPVRAKVMVRTPIKLLPSIEGQTIHIASDFVRIVSDGGQGVFYDEAQREWVQTMQSGSWLIGFQAPLEIGRIVPTRAELTSDIAAPGHRIVLRKDQTLNGVVKENAGGTVVADWDRVVGARSVRFDLDPADADSNGCVWLRLTVEEAGSGGSTGALAQWKFNRLAMEMDARVEAEK